MMVDGALGPVINADTTEIIWDPCLHFHSSNHNMFHLRLLSQGMYNRELTPVDMQSFFAKSPSVGRADGYLVVASRRRRRLVLRGPGDGSERVVRRCLISATPRSDPLFLLPRARNPWMATRAGKARRSWEGRPRLRRHRPPVAGWCTHALPMCLYEFLSPDPGLSRSATLTCCRDVPLLA